MVGKVTVSPPSDAEAEVVDLVRALIRFDTSNTGDPATTKGEAECARWVAEQLQEVGYETEYIEAGAPGRANVFTRLKGADPARGALMLHGHLDVVPAEASDWSVHPFSGALEDGYVWGRGAIDMKDMVGMIIAVARHFKRVGHRPAARPGVRVRLRRGGRRASTAASGWSTNRPDLFEGVTEAIGEVGGFSLTVPRRDGGERRLYLIETAEKAMILDAADRARPRRTRVLIHDDNAVTAVAEATAKLGRHQFPIVHDRIRRAVPAGRRARRPAIRSTSTLRIWTGRSPSSGSIGRARRRDTA